MTEYPFDRRTFLKTSGITLAGTTVLTESAVAQETSGGDLIWEFETGYFVIDSSPTVVDDTVFIGSWDTSMYALDASDGTELWEFKTAGEIDSAPSVVDGTVFIGSLDGNLYGVDASDGTEQWRYNAGETPGGEIWSSPTVANETVYLGDYEGNLHAVDAADGTEQWVFETGDWIDSSPTVLEGTVFVGSRDENLYAVNATDGTEQWRFETNNFVISSPTVANGTVFFGSSDNNLYAVDSDDGSEVWRLEAPGTSSPTVLDKTVFVGSGAGNLYAVDANDGSEKWIFEADGAISSSPTVADSTVVVGSSDDNLYGVDRETGEELWRFETRDEPLRSDAKTGIQSSPTVVDGTAFVGSLDGYVYAIDVGSVGSSEDTRVTLGTLGHHHVFAEQGPTGPGMSDPSEVEASFTFEPESPDVGETVTFDASTSEGEIEEYRWDFNDDGETDATGETAEFQFEEQDEFSVTLTVVDTDGDSATSTQTVDVGPSVFEQLVDAKLDTAAEIDDAAVFLSESEEVETVVSGIRDEFSDGSLDSETAEEAVRRLNTGEQISYRLLVKTGEATALEGVEDEKIAVDTTRFTIELGVGIALSAISISEVADNAGLGRLVPDNEILREKFDAAVEELVSYGFSHALQSEALSEINRISLEAYNGILDGQFDDGDEFFEFVSDSISATVANLTLMQTIETGDGFSAFNKETSAFIPIDKLTNVESSLSYLNTELNADTLTDKGLDGTLEGAQEASDNATNLMNEIASTTDTFLFELSDRIDIPGIIKDAFEIVDGIRNGELVDTVDAVTFVSVVLLPKAGLAVTAVQAIGTFVGELSIRLLMTTHAWGIAGVQQGDPITLDELRDLIPDVNETLAAIEPVEDRWGEFV
ncbi:PQQ-binding-like beta-propeller repeat protein [Halobacteriaceae archaeon SHR40]|uniref:outer membrane protein assembly factor BamB family protein n=1 Tax=Halovenus amylolytica TaxID=2500550 RepID=UPI000FE437E9